MSESVKKNTSKQVRDLLVNGVKSSGLSTQNMLLMGLGFGTAFSLIHVKVVYDRSVEVWEKGDKKDARPAFMTTAMQYDVMAYFVLLIIASIVVAYLISKLTSPDAASAGNDNKTKTSFSLDSW